ncbi:MAG: NAD-dependent epimerase/dehydratase family protein [Geminicoccaceae bacterium]
MTDDMSRATESDRSADAAGSRRLLVTGVTGFVGRHLVRTLGDRGGTALRLLVRHGTVADLPESARGCSELAQGDLTDPGGLPALCAGVEAVLHAAALMPNRPGRQATAEELRRTNTEGTLALAEAAAAAGVRRFVFVSSTAAMGSPTSERIDETAPCRPTNPYGESKRRAEQGLLELGARTGLEVVILRPCVVAGEGQLGGQLLRMFQLCRKGWFPAFGGRLEQHKPMVDVEDLAQAIILAADRGPAGEVYLITSGIHYSMREMLTITGELTGNPRPYLPVPLPLAWAAAVTTTPLARLVGREPPLSPGRIELFLADRRIDIGKARRELGYAPHFRDLRAMLARTYAWYGMTGQL